MYLASNIQLPLRSDCRKKQLWCWKCCSNSQRQIDQPDGYSRFDWLHNWQIHLYVNFDFFLTCKIIALFFSDARSMQHAFNKQSVSATSIELKIQSAVWKKPIHIRIEPKQKMKILVILCAEQLKRPANTLLFKFDGDLLDLEATPEDLDFEGGEVLDLRFIDL